MSGGKKPPRIKDWAFSPLLGVVASGKLEFKGNEKVLDEGELDYTVSMLRYKSSELVKGEFLLPIF